MDQAPDLRPVPLQARQFSELLMVRFFPPVPPQPLHGTQTLPDRLPRAPLHRLQVSNICRWITLAPLPLQALHTHVAAGLLLGHLSVLRLVGLALEQLPDQCGLFGQPLRLLGVSALGRLDGHSGQFGFRPLRVFPAWLGVVFAGHLCPLSPSAWMG